MRYRLALVSLVCLLASVTVWGQAPAPSGGCAKTVSFAVAEEGQPVPAIPKFTLKWLGSKTRREDFGKLCFAQVPAAESTNYVIVFSTTPAAFEGLKATAHTYRTSAEGHSGGAAVSSYGGTWTYAYTGVTPPPTTDTLELKRDDKPKSVEVRAFDQNGKVVAQGSLASSSSREKLLEKVLSDILKDSPTPETRKLWAAQLPVYYVNCDVDADSTSPKLQPVNASVPAAAPSIPTAPKPAAPAPPPPALDIWSTPAGADIFVDGTYVGRTPYTMTLSEGEHTIDLRKKDFAIWQRKVEVTEGKRRVGGYLEQKVLNLE